MMIRFVLKRYSCNTTSMECVGSTTVDAPFPKEVNEALAQGYLIDDVCIINEAQQHNSVRFWYR